MYNKVNELVRIANEQNEAIADFEAQFEQLHEYVYSYFDNLDVQEEINNKLDEMAEDGSLSEIIKDYVDPIIESQNDQIAQIGSLVAIATSGSPAGVYDTVADLESADPDHSKIYVVTATGNWYYYNTTNSAWTSGGAYQSSKISDGQIESFNLDSNLKGKIYKNYETANLCNHQMDVVQLLPGASGATDIKANANARAVIIPITGGKSYKVRKVRLGNTFRVCSSVDYPSAGVTMTSKSGSTPSANAVLNENYHYYTTGDSDKYLLLYFYNTETDAGIDYATIYNSLGCYEMDDYTPQRSYSEYNEALIKDVEYDTKTAIFSDLGTENLFNPFDKSLVQEMTFQNGSNLFVEFAETYTIVFPLEPDTDYIVNKTILTSRFRYAFTDSYPFVRYTEHTAVTTADDQYSFTFNSGSYKYITILVLSTAVDPTLSIDDVLKSITIAKGSSIVEPTLKVADLLSDDYINLVKIRQVGTLHNSYIALSCDDGNNALATVTIPMLNDLKTELGHNIPVTLGLMSTSQIFSNSTNLGIVADYLDDQKGSVAIHGSVHYPTLSNSQLFDFLNQQKAFLTTNLQAPSSIIYPYHDYDDASQTIAGSFYGVCCTGGAKRPITYGQVGDQPFCNGERSNMYTLYRFSILHNPMTENTIKQAIDYAYDHNMIFLPWWHDNEITDDNKHLIQYCIRYASSKGLKFINVGDIPTIN
jgi:hypothetical protein